MNRGLYVGKSGMKSFQEKMDTISNNIANVQTAGYKKLTSGFQELLRDEVGMLGTPLSKEIEAKNPTLGTGVKLSEPYRIFTQGVMTESGNPIECAIDGEGFFSYRDGQGNLKLSRAANLNINIADGSLIDENGNRLEVQNGINLLECDPGSVEIGLDGKIRAKKDDQTVEAGTAVLYYIPTKDVLKDSGSGYYSIPEGTMSIRNTDANVPRETFGLVHQGYIEGSNADMGAEMVDLMVTQRGYQLSLKAVQTADEMWGQTNNLLRR